MTKGFCADGLPDGLYRRLRLRLLRPSLRHRLGGAGAGSNGFSNCEAILRQMDFALILTLKLNFFISCYLTMRRRKL